MHRANRPDTWSHPRLQYPRAILFPADQEMRAGGASRICRDTSLIHRMKALAAGLS